MKQKKPAFSLTLTQMEQIFGWAYLLAQFLLVPSLIYTLGAMLGIRSEALLNVLYYCTNAAFCLLIFRQLLGQSLLNAGGKIKELLLSVTLGFLVYMGLNSLMGQLITLFAPDFANVNDASIAAMVAQHPVLMGLGTAVLAPIAEELLFRGLIFVPLASKNPKLACALSTLAFCAVHVVGYIGDAPPLTLLICFVQYIPAGVCLCWACHKSDSIFAPMLIHSAINAVSLMALR